MHEIPPVPGRKNIESMTLEELDRKIEELDKELEYWYEKNTAAGGRHFEDVLAPITNERARYDMRRVALLREKPEGA